MSVGDDSNKMSIRSDLLGLQYFTESDERCPFVLSIINFCTIAIFTKCKCLEVEMNFFSLRYLD